MVVKKKLNFAVNPADIMNKGLPKTPSPSFGGGAGRTGASPIDEQVKEESTTKPIKQPTFKAAEGGTGQGVFEYSKDGLKFSLPTNQQQEQKLTPKNQTQEYAQEQQNFVAQQQVQESLAQIGQLTPEQQAITNSAQASQGMNLLQAVKAGIGNINPVVVGGATIGGAATGLAGGPLAPLTSAGSALLAGGTTAITQFYSGAKAELKQQRSKQYSIASSSLTDHMKNMRAFTLARDVNAYNEQLAFIYRDYGQLSLNSKENINDFLGNNGIETLTEYENFINNGGLDGMNTKLSLALANPKANALDLYSEEELAQ